MRGRTLAEGREGERTRGESGRRGACAGREGLRECKGRERDGGGGETPSLLLEKCLGRGMISGAGAGIRSGGTCTGRGGEGVGVKVPPSKEGPTLGKTARSPTASLGVETRLLSYVSSVTWTEKEVLEGEVREHDSQEQLV